MKASTQATMAITSLTSPRIRPTSVDSTTMATRM
jgi:hypothetical protein